MNEFDSCDLIQVWGSMVWLFPLEAIILDSFNLSDHEMWDGGWNLQVVRDIFPWENNEMMCKIGYKWYTRLVINNLYDWL